MRKALFGLFVAAILLDLVALAALAYAAKSEPRFVFDARKALLGRFTADRRLLEASPRELVASPDFATDRPELVAKWRREVPERVDYLSDVSRETLPRDPVMRAQAIVRLFSRNGGPGCGAYEDLLDNIRRLPRDGGRGCCSDHAQVFVALASVYGLDAREVHQHRPSGRGHTYNEFWHPGLERWIYIDPQLAVMARGADGAYLSQTELRERRLRDRPVDFVFFGTAAHRLHGQDPGTYHFYDEASDFTDVTLTLGNNVFEQERFDHRLAFLPRPAVRAIGYLTGRVPAYQMLLDEHARKAPELRSLRILLLGGGGLLALGTLAYPALRVAQTLSGRLRRRTGGAGRAPATGARAESSRGAVGAGPTDRARRA